MQSEKDSLLGFWGRKSFLRRLFGLAGLAPFFALAFHLHLFEDGIARHLFLIAALMFSLRAPLFILFD